ncbi:MAG: PEGA domain-containing protein [Candidatus Manganitrophaceae bacterium]|nr:MAG: PEGA domain-containing protein [Candidatus Manganitrophaceae bacterium]
MRPTALFVVSISLLFFASGCATLFSEKEDIVTIKSEPPGADVYLGDRPLGTTPLTIPMKRSISMKRLNLRKEGYKTREVKLETTVAPVAFLNCATCPFFILTPFATSSWGTDITTGKMIRYDPTSYYIELESEAKAPEAGARARSDRAAFVLYNIQGLKSDIARGEGEYLSAYYRLIDNQESESVFLQRIRESAPALLSRPDAVDLHNDMEDNLK